jgi:hypothetical protein
MLPFSGITLPRKTVNISEVDPGLAWMGTRPIQMAATDECSVNHLLCQDDKNNTEQEEKCLCCAKLRLELQKARTELAQHNCRIGSK